MGGLRLQTPQNECFTVNKQENTAKINVNPRYVKIPKLREWRFLIGLFIRLHVLDYISCRPYITPMIYDTVIRILWYTMYIYSIPDKNLVL